MNELKQVLDDRLDAVNIELDEDVKRNIAELSDRYGMVLLMAYDFLRWTKENGYDRGILKFDAYVLLEITEGKQLTRELLDEHFRVKWDAQKTIEWKNKIDYISAWDEVR